MLTRVEVVDAASTLALDRSPSERGRSVDVNREAPEPWASALIDAGLVDPRGKTPRASMSALARATGAHTSTITEMVFGGRRTDDAVIELTARALGRDVREVARWAGRTRTVREPYEVPDEVHRLTRRQQAALTELIRAIAEERDGDDRDAAPTSTTGDSPAHVTARVPDEHTQKAASPRARRSAHHPDQT